MSSFRIFVDLVHEAFEFFLDPRELFLCVLFDPIYFEIGFLEFLDELF